MKPKITHPVWAFRNFASQVLLGHWKLAKESGWIIGGHAVSVVGSLLLVRLLTSHLSAKEYGELALALTSAGLVNQVVTGAIAAGLARYYSSAIEEGSGPGYLGAVLSLTIYAFILICLVAITGISILVLGGYTQKTHYMAATLWLAIAYGYNGIINSIQNAARQRQVVAVHVAIDCTAKIALSTLFIILAGPNVETVIIAFALSASVVGFSQYLSLRRLLPEQARWDESCKKWRSRVWSFAWPIAAGGSFSWAYTASQRWSLELYSSTADVGRFYALTQLAYTPIALAGSILISLTTPLLYARAGIGNQAGRIAAAERSIFGFAVIGISATFIAALLLHAWSKELFQVFVPEGEYHGISSYMPIVAISSGLLQVSLMLSTAIAITGETEKLLTVNILGNSFIAVLNVVLTKLHGVGGLFIAMLIGSFIHLVWTAVIVLSASRKRWNTLKLTYSDSIPG